MSWWGWIAAGMLMLVAELALVDAAFYLVFLGISALLVGAVVLAGIDLPFWMQWTLFALLAVGSLVFFRGKVYDRLRGGASGEIQEGVTGDAAIAQEAIAPGARGRVELRGTTWTAHNCGATRIEAGSRCRVERAEGLTLEVRAEA
jgi:membrane protein implicated in regulation of membrane protease activity